MKAQAIALSMLVLAACSKQQTTSDVNETLQWQRLKAMQFYWEGERARHLEGFSNALQQASESVYWNGPSNSLSGHIYRFLWLRTFDRPIVVTMRSTPDGQVEIRSKTLSGQSGFSIGPIEQERAITNKTAEVDALMADLDRWLPHVPEYDGDFGADGSTWMIDGVKDGKYYMVHRWSPETGWVRDMGLRFLEVAKIREKKVY